MAGGGRRGRFDPISVVEAAYRLDGDLPQWVEAIARVCRPALDHGLGVQAVGYSWDHPYLLPETVAVEGTPPGIAEYLATINDHAPQGEGGPASLLRFPSARLYSFRELVSPWGHQDFFVDHPPVGDIPPLRDWGAVMVREAGFSLLVGGFSTNVLRLTEGERQRWHKLAVHLGAGLRLRLALAVEDTAPEAVFEADGRCSHAEGPAKSHDARAVLREAAKQIDRARGELRREDGNEALALWRGLVGGRWSLVDRFDTDGRRYVLALKNEPGHRDPRALTVPERQVVNLLATGFSNQEIAYALGLSTSTIGSRISRALRKLGLRRRHEVAGLLAGGDARVHTAPTDQGTIAIGSHAVAVAPGTAGLTAAEAEVASAVLRGWSDREIAEEREVSPRTVANQLRSVFRKLNVQSRSQLASALHSAGHTNEAPVDPDPQGGWSSR